MEEAKTQNGLVGFFDILGYQSFLENNDAQSAASEVLSTINDIGTIVTSELIRSFQAPDERARTLVDSIRWLVFSDTILMTMEWKEPKVYEWTIFCLTAVHLLRHMFDFGLPLRGAIMSGQYLVSRSCFAGRVLVDAYRAESTLNLAACSIDKGLVDLIKGLTNQDSMLVERLAPEYMTPLKDGRYAKLSLLNYFLPDDIRGKPCSADIPQLVLNSFWAHRKDLTASGEVKAKNTESFLRFLFHRFPSMFSQ